MRVIRFIVRVIREHQNFLVLTICIAASAWMATLGISEGGRLESDDWLVASGFPILGGSIWFLRAFFRKGATAERFSLFIILAACQILYFSFVYIGFDVLDSSGIKGGMDANEALYFSLSVWLNANVSDFRPTPELRPWVVYEALLSYVYMGLFIAKLVHLLEVGKSAHNQANSRAQLNPNRWDST